MLVLCLDIASGIYGDPADVAAGCEMKPEYCSDLPDSSAGKGCPGAVQSDCTGNSGSTAAPYPWFAVCCFWTGTECVPTVIAPSPGPEILRLDCSNEPYSAFQFIPTKNAGSLDVQLADIQFENTGGDVIDLSDCTATSTGGTECVDSHCSGGQCEADKAIDGDFTTTWCQYIATSISDLVMVISCNTPKTVANFRWAPASHVSPPC